MSNEELLSTLRSIIKEELSPINNRLDKIESRLDKIESRLDKVESRLDILETRLENLEGQVKENTDFIEVLLHRTEELNAQMHNLSINVDKLCGQVTTIQTNMATKEDIARMEYKISFLNDRLLNQEYEIHRLKAAK